MGPILLDTLYTDFINALVAVVLSVNWTQNHRNGLLMTPMSGEDDPLSARRAVAELFSCIVVLTGGDRT